MVQHRQATARKGACPMSKLKKKKELLVFLVESMNASDRIVTSFTVAGLVAPTMSGGEEYKEEEQMRT